MSDKSGSRNPPKHSRFKKGVSGNPKGRPKRRKGQLVSHIISKVQNTPTAYREGGRTKLASRLELALKKLVNGALEGDARTAAELFALAALTFAVLLWLRPLNRQPADSARVPLPPQ